MTLILSLLLIRLFRSLNPLSSSSFLLDSFHLLNISPPVAYIYLLSYLDLLVANYPLPRLGLSANIRLPRC